MLTRADKLKKFLDYIGVSSQEFARLVEVSETEAEKLLNGEAVEYDTAHNFIYWMKGYVAQHYIDWERMGIRNPLRNWYALAENDTDRDEDSPDDDYDPDEDEDEFDSATYYEAELEEDDLDYIEEDGENG